MKTIPSLSPCPSKGIPGGPVAIVLLLLPAMAAHAQTGDGQAGIQQATDMISGYFDTGTSLMYAIGVIVGLVVNPFGAIIGKIQENMPLLDISQVEASGDTFFSATDTAYLIFLLIGIVGYFTVPNVANYIVHAGGGNALLYKVTNLLSSASHTTVSAGGMGTSYAATTLGAGASQLVHGLVRSGSAPHQPEASQPGSDGPGSYQHERLSGNTNP